MLPSPNYSARLDNMQVILLGDFNAVPSQANNPSNSNKFFEQLDNDNIYNTFDLLFDDANARFPTFNNKICITPSRIDHIYCSDRLAIDIHTATIIEVDDTFTDHNIATTSFYISELVPQSNKAPTKKISFHYDKMSHDDWTNFANKTDALLSSCQLANLDNIKLKSKHALNFYWDLIQGCIIKAAEKFISIHHSSQHARDLRPKTLKKIYQQLLIVQK